MALEHAARAAYDQGMQKAGTKKRWLWAGLLAVLGLALVAAVILPGVVLNRAGREVVYDHPLRADSAGVVNSQADAALTDAPLTGAALTAALTGSPRASLPESFFDFGTIRQADQVQHDFLLRNAGSAPLIIQRAYTTCGCTTADFSTGVIPPGKAARITITFDAGFHPLQAVTVRRGLIIETSDQQHPQLELWVQASIK
jgi:hypothetical protein